jgi:hypothetical protein
VPIHWATLPTCVKDGGLPIENNDVEQLMKQAALGRKKQLFVGRVAVGECIVRLLSAVISALRNDRDGVHSRFAASRSFSRLIACRAYWRAVELTDDAGGGAAAWAA